jgi:hypothetical protein
LTGKLSKPSQDTHPRLLQVLARLSLLQLSLERPNQRTNPPLRPFPHLDPDCQSPESAIRVEGVCLRQRRRTPVAFDL